MLASQPAYMRDGKATFEGVAACVEAAGLAYVDGWQLTINPDGGWAVITTLPGEEDEWQQGMTENPESVLADIRAAVADAAAFTCSADYQTLVGDEPGLGMMYLGLMHTLDERLPQLETGIAEAEAALNARPPAQVINAPERAQSRTI